ncbi:chromatin modifying protein-like protein 2B [Tribonema minus]|uniref:Chromatin modifying protein-like protein 2B n=1 Tax=Tribonema minus TaxID=303371 RepID=A0A835YLS1_9STRA|nr:chromatin modifying protein-like protein 2B [Tribonema minus]
MFKAKPDPKEVARSAKRQVRQGERDVERELRNLDRVEKQLIIDIKKTARKPGGEKATRNLAGQLVGLRKQRDKLYTMKSTITAVGYQTTAIAGQAAMAGVMGSVTGAMKDVNAQLSPQEMAAVLQQFALQSETMGMREELMDDALTDAFDGDGVEAETDAIVDQVLTEIGLDMTSKMADAPTGKPAAGQQLAQDDSMLDQRAEELLKQLQAL